VRFAKATGSDLKPIWAAVADFTLAEAKAEVEQAEKKAATPEKKVSPARSTRKAVTAKPVSRRSRKA
jgi:hypothetical protein